MPQSGLWRKKLLVGTAFAVALRYPSMARLPAAADI
jgi:hypothetical protein